MKLTIDYGPLTGEEIEFPENAVSILIGKNGAGKSKILESIKRQFGDAVRLAGNYENIEGINDLNKEGAIQRQRESEYPHQVTSIIAADPLLTKIFKYFFKALFNIELTVEATYMKGGEFNLGNEADGFKSLFNIIYYLVSPFKVLLLDEPERFLHPTMRNLFTSLLSQIAQNYGKTIIVTSHSKGTIRFDLPNVFLYQIQKDPKKLTSINNWLTNLNSPSYVDAKHKQSFTDWFYYHTSVLFAKSTGLVEGVSDQIVIEAVRTKLAFDLSLDDISINHVGSSHHDSGGKARLHKIQNFLNTLIPTFVIADKDIITSGINKWHTPASSDSDEKIISDSASNYDLYILHKGAIEDYYFLEPLSEFCTSTVTAKANKISAAYEQASIIFNKDNDEVIQQYSDIVDILKHYSGHQITDELLEALAQEYLIDRYVYEKAESEHVTGTESSDGTEIIFKFIGPGKKWKVPQEKVEELKKAKEASKFFQR